MKRSFLILFLLPVSLCMAQVKTAYYANGNKMYEGKFVDASPDFFAPTFESLPKEDKARLMASAKKDGEWKTWFENGTIASEEVYRNGVITGHWKQYTIDGKISADLNFGSGISTFFYTTGQKESQGLMLEGYVLEGEWTGFHENGKISFTGKYNKGQKDGVWVYYNVDGSKNTEQTYNNGVLVK
ncbi:MAG: toxin-antitoxin system YwqK family antitoxin [Bacteroidota bacterium]|jgi:antitoxin component YwqK of YwqJK toxin-antitoxin module